MPMRDRSRELLEFLGYAQTPSGVWDLAAVQEAQLRLAGLLEADALEAEPDLYKWNQTKLAEFAWQQGLKRYGSSLARFAQELLNAENAIKKDWAI